MNVAAEARTNWTTIKCDSCDGKGVVANYGTFGLDFEGPEECGDCEGKGHVWRSPTGRLASYPGGRFVGRDT